MNVVGTHHVAHAMTAVKGGALTLGLLPGRPARSSSRAQADRAHLIEAHDHTVLGCLAVEREHPGGLGLIVGVGTGLPGPGALKGQAGLREDPPEVRWGDLNNALLCQMARQPLQRPARRRNPDRLGTGTGHRDDRSALLIGDPAGTPVPPLRVKRCHPPLVEVVDHLAHVRLIGHPHRRDLRHGRGHIRRQQNRCALARANCLAFLALLLSAIASACSKGLTKTSGGRINTSKVAVHPNSTPTTSFQSNLQRQTTRWRFVARPQTDEPVPGEATIDRTMRTSAPAALDETAAKERRR